MYVCVWGGGKGVGVGVYIITWAGLEGDHPPVLSFSRWRRCGWGGRNRRV